MPLTDPHAQAALDACLQQAVAGTAPAALPALPGIVAMVTDARHTVYSGAAGLREAGRPERPMAADAVFALYSTSKPMTVVCALQLVEEGRLALDEPAGRHLPALDRLQVLEGFDADGQPRTRPPRRRITVRDLVLHTAGFGYDFFSADDQRYRKARGVPKLAGATHAALETVLLHEPGSAWHYGIGIDWLGRVVEALRGARLGAVMAEHLFAPAGMADIGFGLTDAMRDRRVTLHARAADGGLQPLPKALPPDPPPADLGGQGLHGTVGAWMAFLRLLLNDGLGPHARVLQPASVQALCADGLAPLGLAAGGWASAAPALCRPGELLPGVAKGWAGLGLVNRAPAPSGRPAGTVMWSGLANVYFWLDRANGLGGYWATQLLPFADEAALAGFNAFEATVYRHRA